MLGTPLQKVIPPRLVEPYLNGQRDMAEVCVLRWLALDMTGSLLPPPTPNGGGPASTVPEFYTLPVPIPVGTEMYRITSGAQEFIARYDGQVWLRPARGI